MIRSRFASFIIVAAGRGVRYGPSPKVLEPAAGQPLIWWSLTAAAASDAVGEIVIVAGEQTIATVREIVDGAAWPVPVRIVTGGARRQDSVAAGVAASEPGFPVILVHDAARPLIEPLTIDACAMAVRSDGPVIVASPITDTLKRSADGTIVQTISRDGLWGAQTPQGFPRAVLEDAIAQCEARGLECTDEASMLEALGIAVRIVPGPRTNIKVTHAEDLEMVQALLDRRVRSGVSG